MRRRLVGQPRSERDGRPALTPAPLGVGHHHIAAEVNADEVGRHNGGKRLPAGKHPDEGGVACIAGRHPDSTADAPALVVHDACSHGHAAFLVLRALGIVLAVRHRSGGPLLDAFPRSVGSAAQQGMPGHGLLTLNAGGSGRRNAPTTGPFD